MTLSELQKGESGKVISINNSNTLLKKRMLEMGVTRGVKVTIKKVAPFGDPVSIELRGYELCLRKRDLESVMVIRL